MISLCDVCKKYEKGEKFAVKDFNLEVKQGDFVVLVGPSGCGKSTTLRMIAGLEEISSGALLVDGELYNHKPPREREFAMVFQNYALYPHLNVFENIAFSLRVRSWAQARVKERVHKVASLLQIDDLLERYPQQLSGGQRQRVAIGGAIARDSKILLMDEPLSNLDAKLREEMRIVISEIHENLGTTIIYVTHDQVEAMTLGSKIVVMKDGLIQQIARPEILYDHPQNMFTAEFIGTPQINFMEVYLIHRNSQWFLNPGESLIPISKDQGERLFASGYDKKAFVLGFRPSMLSLTGPDEAAHLRAKITGRELLGGKMILYTVSRYGQFTVNLPTNYEIKSGQEIALKVNLDRALVFDMDSGLNIFPYNDDNEKEVAVNE